MSSDEDRFYGRASVYVNSDDTMLLIDICSVCHALVIDEDAHTAWHESEST